MLPGPACPSRMHPTAPLRLWVLLVLATCWCWAASVFTPWAVDLAPRLWLYDLLFYARALLLFWGACEVLRMLLRRDGRAATLAPLALVVALAAVATGYAGSEAGWRWKVAASGEALRASTRARDHDARHRAGHFIVDTVRHPCRDGQPWLWLGRPHGAGSGTNLALVHAGDAPPQSPMADAFAFRAVRDGWWLAYQHAAHYQRALAGGIREGCRPGRVLERHRDGRAFVEAGRGG